MIVRNVIAKHHERPPARDYLGQKPHTYADPGTRKYKCTNFESTEWLALRNPEGLPEEEYPRPRFYVLRPLKRLTQGSAFEEESQ